MFVHVSSWTAGVILALQPSIHQATRAVSKQPGSKIYWNSDNFVVICVIHCLESIRRLAKMITEVCLKMHCRQQGSWRQTTLRPLTWLRRSPPCVVIQSVFSLRRSPHCVVIQSVFDSPALCFRSFKASAITCLLLFVKAPIQNQTRS